MLKKVASEKTRVDILKMQLAMKQNIIINFY